MLIPHYGDEPPPYKDYRKKTFDKFTNRASELVIGVRSCSLTTGDKKALLKLISEIINTPTNK
ncbi:MAG: hypothetical protein K0S44_242 [Bacteroidetes bacterium]|jgi:hypothetical protein|nr:hypothetical protein [Bacteroidota bacterium]